MFNRLDLRGTKKPLGELLPQLAIDSIAPRATVRSLLDEVRLGGDNSVRELTVRFDGVDVPVAAVNVCLLYTSPSPRDLSTSRMPSSA